MNIVKINKIKPLDKFNNYFIWDEDFKINFVDWNKFKYIKFYYNYLFLF
jgi:hypothetical protein